MSANLMLRSYEYQDMSVDLPFMEDAFFNATVAADAFGKRPNDWLSLESTKEYLAVLSEIFKYQDSWYLKVRQGRHGGGTWLHPDLAIPFCRWLDVRFAVWCDQQIKQILFGQTSAAKKTEYRFHALRLRILKDLVGTRDAFHRQTLLDHLSQINADLNLPMPPLHLLGKPAEQISLEGV